MALDIGVVVVDSVPVPKGRLRRIDVLCLNEFAACRIPVLLATRALSAAPASSKGRIDVAGTFYDQDGVLALMQSPELAQELPQPACTMLEAVNAALHVLRKKFARSWDEIDAHRSATLRICTIVSLDEADSQAALRLAQQHNLDLQAAVSMAIAARHGCEVVCADVLYSGWSTDNISVQHRHPGVREESPGSDKPAPRRATPAARLKHLYERPGFLLRRAHQISVAVFESACDPVGMTPAQFAVLTVLRAEPGLDQSRLSRAIGLDKVTVSHLLRALEQRGLVMRNPALESRRSLALSLTPIAKALLDQVEPYVEAAYQQFFSPLAPDEQQQLLSFLDRLNTQLDPLARAPFRPVLGRSVN